MGKNTVKKEELTDQKKRRNIVLLGIRIFFYGLLLFLVYMIGLFLLLSIDVTVPIPLLTVLLTILLGLTAFYLSLKTKITSSRTILFMSIGWTIEVFAILFAITTANDTTQIFFGTWFTWIPFLGIFFGNSVNAYLKRNLD